MTSPAAHCSFSASATVTVSAAQCQHSVSNTLNTQLQAAQRQSVGVVSLTNSHFTGRSLPHSVTGKLGDAVSQ
jgi:hypothetical protein